MLLAVVGNDADGGDLAHAIGERGVSSARLIRQRGRKTLAKKRITAGGQVVCRVDQGDVGPIDEEAEARLVRGLVDCWRETEAVIISDYGYGALTANAIAALAQQQRQSPRLILADSKRLPAFREIGLTAAKPNYREALSLLGLQHESGHPRERAERLAAFGPRLLELAGAGIAALTLDTEGALVFERGRPPYRTYTEPRPQSFSCGAGDTYLAGLALALAAGADTPTAAEIAAAAAAVVVGKSGTATCTDRELRSHLSGGTKIVDREELWLRLEAERRRGRRIVLTNGCFDILHRGHVTYLARSKALGDVLVVGVNSDASIRRLKGADRPINALEDRLHVLAALSGVDYLLPFDESTPHEIIRAVRPHIFVKGGDYTRDRLPEAALVEELGGEVRILSFVADRSTTGLIEKIRTAQRHQELHLNELNGCRS